MRIKTLQSLKKQRGLAVVEFALTVPFLLVIILVTSEFTRVFYEFNTLTKSVRDAARFAVEDAFTAADILDFSGHRIATTKNLAVSGAVQGGEPLLDGMSVDDVTVSVVNLGDGVIVRPHIRVTATYSFIPLSPVISGMGFLPNDIGMNFQLQATSTMRAL